MGIQDKAFTGRRSQDGRQRFLQSLPEGPLTRGGNGSEEVCCGQGGVHQLRLHQGEAGLHLPRSCGQDLLHFLDRRGWRLDHHRHGRGAHLGSHRAARSRVQAHGNCARRQGRENKTEATAKTFLEWLSCTFSSTFFHEGSPRGTKSDSGPLESSNPSESSDLLILTFTNATARVLNNASIFINEKRALKPWNVFTTVM